MFNDFSLWHVLYLLVTTHITIVMVTVYLHRGVAHRSLTVKKPLEHFFRFWCWLTTGQSPKEWASVHRKHHAFCEKLGDPHSPKLFGFWTVLFKGVSLYKKEARNPETLKKYGHFTPDDWLEKNIYAKYSWLGLTLLGFIDFVLFGWHALWIYTLQLIWIPLWAAGVINGLGHFKGYKNFNTNDDSTNILPIGIIIGGEELHNNHHAYPTSAKLSVKWYEFDIGWMWIKIFEFFGLIKVNKTFCLPTFDKNQIEPSESTLNAFLSHKYLVLKMFKNQTVKDVKLAVILIKNENKELSSYSVKALKRIFYDSVHNLEAREKLILEKLLENSWLKLIHEKKESLISMWNNRNASFQQLKEELKLWCDQAIASGHQGLAQFAQKVIWLKASVN